MKLDPSALCWRDYDFERRCLCGIPVPPPQQARILRQYRRQTRRLGRAPRLGEPMFPPAAT